MNEGFVVKLTKGQLIITDTGVIGVYWGPSRTKDGDMHHVVMPDAYDEPVKMTMVRRRFIPYNDFPQKG